MKPILGSVIAAAVLLVSPLSNAAPISFLFGATSADLILDGVEKSGIDFTVRFVVDTDQVSYIRSYTPWYGGLTGTLAFSDGTLLSFEGAYVFNNRKYGVAGFGLDQDLFDLRDARLGAYDGVSSFGPVGSADILALHQWVELPTSAGLLSVSSVQSATFSARLEQTSLPEPESLALLAMGIVGIGLSRQQPGRR